MPRSSARDGCRRSRLARCAARRGGARCAAPWLDALDRHVGDVVSPHALARAHAGSKASRSARSVTTACAPPRRALSRLSRRCSEAHAGEDRLARPAGRRLQLLSPRAPRARRRSARPRPRLRGTTSWRASRCAEHTQRSSATTAIAAARSRRTHSLPRPGIAFERCADCHEDPHGRDFLGERDCGICHRERGFRADALAAKGFEHARDTGFALEGAHGAVACAGCHTEARARRSRPPRAPPARARRATAPAATRIPLGGTRQRLRDLPHPRALGNRRRGLALRPRARHALPARRAPREARLLHLPRRPHLRRRRPRVRGLPRGRGRLPRGRRGQLARRPRPARERATLPRLPRRERGRADAARLRARVPDLPPGALRLAARDEEAPHRRAGGPGRGRAACARARTRARRSGGTARGMRRGRRPWPGSRGAACTTPRSPKRRCSSCSSRSARAEAAR